MCVCLNLCFCIKLVVLVLYELSSLHIFSNVTARTECLLSPGLQPATHLGREGGRRGREGEGGREREGREGGREGGENRKRESLYIYTYKGWTDRE